MKEFIVYVWNMPAREFIKYLVAIIFAVWFLWDVRGAWISRRTWVFMKKAEKWKRGKICER